MTRRWRGEGVEKGKQREDGGEEREGRLRRS